MLWCQCPQRDNCSFGPQTCPCRATPRPFALGRERGPPGQGQSLESPFEHLGNKPPIPAHPREMWSLTTPHAPPCCSWKGPTEGHGGHGAGSQSHSFLQKGLVGLPRTHPIVDPSSNAPLGTTWILTFKAPLPPTPFQGYPIHTPAWPLPGPAWGYG